MVTSVLLLDHRDMSRDHYLYQYHDGDRYRVRELSRDITRHRERNRNMKISVQDVSHVNWDKVQEQLTEECTRQVAVAVGWAKDTLELLKPGERKTLTVKVGSITVARPRD